MVTYATGYILSEIGNHSWWGQAGSPQNIAANAIVGGISSELQGGSFGHGFWAAGFASVAKPMIYEQWGFSPDKRVQRVAAAAIIGGTASAVSGGKFANGAMTGAFNQLYNGETYASKKWNEVKGIASKMYDTYLNSTQSIGISYEMPWRVDGEWQSFGLEVGFVSQSLFHPDGFAFGIYWMTTAGGSLFPWGDIKGTIDITVSQGNLKDFSGSGLIGDVQTPFGGMSVAKSNSGLWAGSFAPGVGLGAGAGIYSTRVLAIGRYYPAECSEFICQ